MNKNLSQGDLKRNPDQHTKTWVNKKSI